MNTQTETPIFTPTDAQVIWVALNLDDETLAEIRRRRPDLGTALDHLLAYAESDAGE